MSNPLAKEINFWGLIRFTAPTMIMMIFMSMYTMVDGGFVSVFIGTDALSAVNVVYPFVNFIIAVAIMLASGGNAMIGKVMGEGEEEQARQNFSFIVLVGFVVGVVLLILGVVFIHPLIRFLGSSEKIYQYCYDYGLSMIIFTPFAILSLMFQHLFVTAGKPTLGLCLTVLGGISNIILDYVLIVPMNLGIRGAALATGIGFMIPAIAGVLYFSFYKKGTLYFVRPKFQWDLLKKVCGNGSSEMVSNLSDALATFLFNIVMMKLLGEDGVAAITIILYAKFLSTAVYLGYSTGIAPLFSYNYGNENIPQLKKLFRLSMYFLGGTSLLVFMLTLGFQNQIIGFFAKEGTHVFNLTKDGFTIFSTAYLFMGFNIFTSGMFTAFSNGRVSASISFLRTFLFLSSGILLLPLVLGVSGVWMAVPLSEILSLAVTIFLLFWLNKEYKYM